MTIHAPDIATEDSLYLRPQVVGGIFPGFKMRSLKMTTAAEARRSGHRFEASKEQQDHQKNRIDLPKFPEIFYDTGKKKSQSHFRLSQRGQVSKGPLVAATKKAKPFGAKLLKKALFEYLF